jgi:hypothetical protein
VVERLKDRVLGVVVELLDLFALNVHRTRQAQDVHEAGLVHLHTDHLRGEGDGLQQRTQLPTSFGMLPLFLDDKAIQCDC